MPWTDVIKYTTAAITISAIQAQEACVALLVALCKNKKQSKRIQLCDAARALFEALPGDNKRFPELLPWQHERIALTASNVADIVVVFSLVDSDLAEEMLDYMLTWPSIYGVNKVLLPASLLIAESTLHNEFPTVVRLRQIVISHLQKRLAEQLAPPSDWRREDKITCSCKDCNELSQFLVSPTQSKWRFKAAEPRRRHLQHFIDMTKSDIDTVTDKKNRPYSLVCTKNQASYQRKVKQSKRDQDALARILTSFK